MSSMHCIIDTKMKSLLLSMIILFICGINNVIGISGPIVDVPDVGRIEGIQDLESAVLKRKYFSFLGIEYGEPPIGDRRFKPSVLRKPYAEIFKATKNGAVCPQLGFFTSDGTISNQVYSARPLPININNISYNDINYKNSTITNSLFRGDENCLLLNIYTPKLPNTSNLSSPLLPVLVFIHGGGFMLGGADAFTEKRFMDEDIVLVFIQYRLGPLGFLCLHTAEAPGNAGLYDQSLALQWINKHISHFRGDPTRVTISGQSAGSASVTFHMLSPLSKGLFHGVIAQSGSAIAGWAVDRDPVRHAMDFAREVGCGSKNKTKSVLCLQKGKRAFEGSMLYPASTPCVQKWKSENFEKFLPYEPMQILKSGNFSHTPGIFGNVRDEGSGFFAGSYLGYLVPRFKEFEKHFLKFQYLQNLMEQMNIHDPSGASPNALMRLHFDGLKIGDFKSMIPGMIDIFGSIGLKAPTYEAMIYNSYYNKNTYFYSFEYPGHTLDPLHFLNHLIPIGVSHGDELIYFNIPTFLTQLNKTETILSRKMIKMWTNFVKYGQPTPPEAETDLVLPEWKQFTEEKPKFLRILSPFDLNMDSDFTKLYTIEKDRAVHKKMKELNMYL